MLPPLYQLVCVLSLTTAFYVFKGFQQLMTGGKLFCLTIDVTKLYYEVEQFFSDKVFATIKARLFAIKLEYGNLMEMMLSPFVAAWLGVHLELAVSLAINGTGKALLDFVVYYAGVASKDRVELKTTHSARTSMLVNESKIATKPEGRLWFVFGNCHGVWIMEYDAANLKDTFGPARKEVHEDPDEDWTELVYEVPVARMTQIGMYSKKK